MLLEAPGVPPSTCSPLLRVPAMIHAPCRAMRWAGRADTSGDSCTGTASSHTCSNDMTEHQPVACSTVVVQSACSDFEPMHTPGTASSHTCSNNVSNKDITASDKLSASGMLNHSDFAIRMQRF